MVRFNFPSIKSLGRWCQAGVLFAVFAFTFIIFVTPAYALGLDLGVAKVGLNENGLKVSAGEGAVSATIGSGGLAVDVGEGVAAAAVDLGEAAVTADSPNAGEGEGSLVVEQFAKGVTSSLTGSDRGRDAQIIDKVPKVSPPPVEVGGILAGAGDLTRGLVRALTNDSAVTGPAVPVVSPVTDVAGGVLEPVGSLIKATVATVAEVPVAGPVVEKTVVATTGVVGAGLELVDSVTGDVLVPLADEVLDLPSTLLTPVLGTVDELLETDLTRTVQSLLMFVSDKGKGIIGTVDGLLPVVNEILEPVGINAGSNYARDGPGEGFYNLTFLPGEETESGRISSSGVGFAPETGFPGLISSAGTRSEKRFPHAERVNSSPVSGMNVNAGSSGTGAGGNQAAVNNTVFKLDRLPLNGVILEFLYPDRLPPFISLFSPPG